MRKIVDSNFLQHQELRDYLSSSKNNFIVLNDYASMEAYKGNTLVSIYKSMEILSAYPSQVIILRDTQTICGLRGRKARLQQRMIDEGQTREFGLYCRRLEAARNGDKRFESQLVRLGQAADTQMDRMLVDAAKMADHFDEIAATLSPIEVKALRSGVHPIDAIPLDRLVRSIMFVSAFLFKGHPKVLRLPDGNELFYTFIFRIAVCMYFLVLHWISVGGAKGAKPETILNDMVDVNFAAYALFFDGLLTHDRK